MRYSLIIAAVFSLFGCSDNAKSLSPGEHLTLNDQAQGKACIGRWDDADAFDNAKSDAERYSILSGDGGSILKKGDTITILGFGAGVDAAIHLRVERTQHACWLAHGDVDDITN